MALFNYGHFTLHSGQESNFLIDANALTDNDLHALAATVAPKILPFRKVVGIPNGGLRFAKALEPYADPNLTAPILIVDDVLTTGASMMAARHQLWEEDKPAPIGLVIFSRAFPTTRTIWITKLFDVSFMLQ